jgi:hypothetical protein
VALYRTADLGNPSLSQFFEGMLAPATAGAAEARGASGSGSGGSGGGPSAVSQRPPAAAVQQQRVLQLHLLAVTPGHQVRTLVCSRVRVHGQ